MDGSMKDGSPRIIRINGKEDQTKEEILREIARQLDFPDHFGMNYDALQDCLGELSRSTVIEIVSDQDGNRSEAADMVCRIAREVAEWNEDLQVVEVTDAPARFPVMDVDLIALRQNAEVMCRFCQEKGLSVAGVIKFSDGDLSVARAYHEGGCAQIASSRTIHLEQIKKTMPRIRTMLIRIPMISETEEVVKWCDISLNSEEQVLRSLNEAAGRAGKQHAVILMQDVGDRREGVIGTRRLTELAVLVEEELESLYLMGIGASFACASGVLPDWDNLSVLAESARMIESQIGRKLDIVSGGSSITLTMLAENSPLPPEINHLRIGGAIANPMGIRLNRGVTIPGMREDAFRLTAEIVELGEKPSPPGGVRKNWSGQDIEYEDRGVRTRAIAAIGSQDIGNAAQLVPEDEGVAVVGGSSDHTILDVTDSSRDWKVGDRISFRMFYMPILYCFSTRHVAIRYT